MDRIAVPEQYFKYIGPAEKEGNSLYECLKCAGSNKLSCHDKSRQNLRKHVEVRELLFNIRLVLLSVLLLISVRPISNEILLSVLGLWHQTFCFPRYHFRLSLATHVMPSVSLLISYNSTVKYSGRRLQL